MESEDIASRRIIIRTEQDLNEAVRKGAEGILSGGVVAFPTESFYGLGAHAEDEHALGRLFHIKHRSHDQPLLILIPSVEVLDRYVTHVSRRARALMDRFWPGGLTLVLPAKPGLTPLLTAGSGKIGIRLSSHPVATALTRAVGGAITGTSANISGQTPCRSAKEVLETLGDRIDLVLDGGKTKGTVGSTILDVTMEPPQILREGMVPRAEIEACLKGTKVS